MSNPSKAKGTDSHLTGLIGEGRFIAYAASRGWEIYRSVEGHSKCDFIVDIHDTLMRVEVKRVESVQNPPSASGSFYVTITKFDSKKFDLLFVSTPQGDYLIPASICPRGSLSIKMEGTGWRGRAGKWDEFKVAA